MRMVLHWIFCIQIRHISEGKCIENAVSYCRLVKIINFFLLYPWQINDCGWTKTNQLISNGIFIIKIRPTQIKADASFLCEPLSVRLFSIFLCAWLCSTAMLLWINIKWWLEEDRGCAQNGILAYWIQCSIYCTGKIHQFASVHRHKS